MNPIKKILKNTGSRVWFIVTAAVLVFALAASIVVTQVGIIKGTFNILFGGERAVISDTRDLYKSDYASKSEVLKAANALSQKTVEEGIVLLKNDDNALPLKKEAGVSVFGKNSVNLVYGGSGSGGSKSSNAVTLYDSLDEAGIKYNTTLKTFYGDNAKSGGGRPKNPEMGDIIAGFATGETPLLKYTAQVKSSYGEFNDAALVVISRIGGEGFDLPRTMKTSYGAGASPVEGAFSASDHYLQLDKNETDMIKEACANFDKVILILNTSQTLELGFLDDPAHDLYSEKIKAALWTGLPGTTGIMALGKVLTGEVNPSGHTTDTYARDFKSDPTYANFGNNSIEGGNNYYTEGKDNAKEPSPYYFVQYEEGLNVGYRYYETRAFEEKEKNADTTWYEDNVVFPFGYGLSYSSFDWEIESVSPAAGTRVNPEDTIKIKVKVTNKGQYDGKDVVQLYYTAPYNSQNANGAIDKSYVVLGGFEKTPLIKAQASASVELSLKVSDMKSYDFSDANKNNFKGYELEQGTYQIKIATNAHDVFETIEYTLGAHRLKMNETEDYTVENRFDDVSAAMQSALKRGEYENTWPSTPTLEERKVDSAFTSSLKYKVNDNGKPWKTDTMPKQAKSVIPKDKIDVTYADLMDKKYDDKLWDQLLDQLTVNQMGELIGTGAFGTLQLENIGKPKTVEPDGPSGFTNFMSEGGPVYDTCFYAAECVMGATWNKELALEMGRMVGNEGLIGNEKGDTLPYSGWYAPAVNIHRSPFSGRNWEYYSEDGYLSGAMAAQVCLGAQEKGVYTFVKHFAVNDQETNRDSDGILVWLNEQVMREIYLKPFEMVVKEGKTRAMMSSFNRIGKTWAGGSYELLTEVLRNEWGFKGMVITDYNLLRYMDADQMIRAGGDLVLNQGDKRPNTVNPDATQVSLIRQATKNILYTIVNSNAMNNVISGYLLPIWQIVMILIDCALVVGLAVWGFFAVRKTLKNKDGI